MKVKSSLPFIHPSYAYEKGLNEDNQRLEFLGDAVLGFIISDKLYTVFPEESEGFLSKCRSHLVSRGHLAAKAREMVLDKKLLLGVGEEKSGGRLKESLLADTFEAFIAQVYLEKGMKKCLKLVDQLFTDDLSMDKLRVLLSRDAKSALQEYVQGKGLNLPVYKIVEASGPQHEQLFVAEVWVGETFLARGEGPTKKEAEKLAARNALKEVEEQNGN